MSQLSFSDIAAVSEEERVLIQGYIALLQLAVSKPLVALGIYRGESEGDLRPAFLNPDGGRELLILRYVHPGSAISVHYQRSWGELPKLFKGIIAASGIGKSPLPHINENCYWFLRRYTPATLSDEGAFGLLTRGKGLESCERIVSQLAELEGRSAPHGHVSRSNLGIQDGQLVLLDPWISCLQTSAKQEIAPPLSPAEFAGLLLQLFGTELDSSTQAALENVAHGNQRLASMSALNQLLSPRTADSFQSAGTARSGRLITKKAKNTERPAAVVNRGEEAASLPSTAVEAPILSSTKKIARKEGSKTSKQFLTRPQLFFLVALTTSLLILFGAKTFLLLSSRKVEGLQDAWESNEADQMLDVARKALLGKDIEAQQVIETDLAAGNERPNVNAHFIKTAYNEKWRDALSEKDKLFALSLSLAGIVRTPAKNLPKLDELHPGVILAMLGDLSLEGSKGKFETLSTDRLATLPAPFGDVFKDLASMGVTSCGSLEARAAARILVGGADPQTLNAFLPLDASAESIEERLRVIAPFCEMSPALAENLIAYFDANPSAFSARITWFSGESLADWKALAAKEKLYLSIGLLKEDALSREQLIDLLTFPAPKTKSQAQVKLLMKLGEGYAPLIAVVSRDGNALSRTQVLGLLTALQMEASAAAAFISSWLQTNPPPHVVLEILLSLRKLNTPDSVSIQLANYLTRSDIDLSAADIGALIAHPEPLARALAFSHLDASRPEDRKVLESWLALESSARLKQQIQAKLDAAR